MVEKKLTAGENRIDSQRVLEMTDQIHLHCKWSIDLKVKSFRIVIRSVSFADRCLQKSKKEFDQRPRGRMRNKLLKHIASTAKIGSVVGGNRARRMNSIWGVLAACVWSIMPAMAADDQSAAETQAEFQLLPMLEQHCFDCHSSGDDSEGNFDLSEWSTADADPEAIASVIRVVQQERMPPEDEPALDPDQRTALLLTLKDQLRTLAASGLFDVVTPLRRMNRFQYNNAVVDLFDLNVTVFTLPEKMMRAHGDYFQPASGKMPNVVTVGSRPLGKSQMIEKRLMGVAAFPQDLRAEHGYDNQADHLSLSPLLMESFLMLAQSITTSRDFTVKTVGIWKTFFGPIPESKDVRQELELRIRPFLTKAFRRPVDDVVMDRYVTFAIHQIESGSDVSDAMKAVAAAAISSPRFLYLYNTRPDAVANGTVDSFGLASRLSFFLWGSIPDEQLLQQAIDGKLTSKTVLAAEVDRMLKDKKLKRFCDSFPAQWLQLERIISSVPERQHFPSFYFLKFRNSMHMMLEPLLVFETVLIEDRPVRQLIDSDFTYRSKRLNEAYGELKVDAKIANRRGQGDTATLGFRRVPVTDRRSGGILTTAAVMTMTSGPERTQPITRGAWMATVIFNDPPEPPPADVPPLDEKSSHDDEELTLRERLSLHRERSDCRGCHEQIDPLGFAFENFNPIGEWRKQYENGREIDVSGTLFRRHKFTNIVEFKDSILAEEDQFVAAFVGHLMAYALARKLTAVDQVAIDRIVAEASDDGSRMQSLIRKVVLSPPFRGQPSLKLGVRLPHRSEVHKTVSLLTQKP